MSRGEGGGRPKKDIDEDQVVKLAGINCSYAEMASVLDCNESTLTRRFAQAIEKGRNSGKMSLKRKQYELAMSGNVSMLIWLGKITLGQRDTSYIDVNMKALLKENEGKTLDQLVTETEQLLLTAKKEANER